MARRVTALVSERRNCVRVELDGTPWRTLPAAAVVAAGLLLGTELDRVRARTLARERRRAIALGAAARALARRDRPAAALAAELERRGVARPAGEEAVARLAQAGYVDDARFAAGRAAVLAHRGFGDDAIRFELEQAGVACELAADAVAALPPERERALTVLLRAKTPLAGVRRLAAKGFAADSIEAAAAEARVELAFD